MQEINARELSILKTFARLCGGAGEIEDIFDLYKGDNPEATVRKKSMIDAEIFYSSTLEKEAEINEAIEKNLINWALNRVDLVDLAILQISIYELRNRETGAAIVINEAVECARKYGGEKSYSFVNGILGAVYREDNPQDLEVIESIESRIKDNEKTIIDGVDDIDLSAIEN